MDENGRKWTKMDENGRKWTKMVLITSLLLAMFGCEEKVETVEVPIYVDNPVFIDKTYVAPVLFMSAKDEERGIVTVTMTCATDNATIYYTIDGSDPTTESRSYTGGYVNIDQETVVKAFAAKDGMENSPISQIDVSIMMKEPSVSAGTYTVKHLLQGIGGDTFTVGKEESRTYNEEVTLENAAGSFTGFTASALGLVGETLMVFYNRNIITYTYHCGEHGAFSDGSTSTTSSGLYGAPIEVPVATDEDYYYESWKTSDGEPANLDVYNEARDFYIADWKKYTVFTYRINDSCECGQHHNPPKFTNQSITCVFKGRPGDTLPDKPAYNSSAYMTRVEWWNKPAVFPDKDTVFPVRWEYDPW